MKEGVAGYITLNNSSSKIVYINIFEAERVTFPYRIISILAHEICHKVLYINQFPYLDGIENERYTDLCTYYLGFGFYTTEGYENYITADVYGKSIILGQKVIGYLSEKTIARAYIISQLCMNQPFNDCSRRKELVERMARVDDLSALIKYRSKVITNVFKYIDFYRIVCPQCGFVSSVSSQNNYRKKFVCKHCGEEFYFTWYIYDNDNPIYKYVPSSTKIDFNPKSPSFLDRIRKWFRKIF